MTHAVDKNHWHISQKGMDAESVKRSFYLNREYTLSKDEYTSTPLDNYTALALTIRDRLVERWIQTQQNYHKENRKRVYYLSLEFLIGKLLGANMYNLGMEEVVAAVLKELGLSWDEIQSQETDAGLGNGGLGRLAACFLESLATMGIPAHGYGIRYEYGIFHQKISDGYQVELPDEWLRHGSPWEFARPEYSVRVKFFGSVQSSHDENGRLCYRWVDTDDVLAVPYDLPVPGYKNDVVNTLRLWSARGTENFDFEYFNSGDYEQAVYQKVNSENISKVLYPNDAVHQGKELRLKQEYFFTAATIADILRRFKVENQDLRDLPEKAAIQLNDTHPTLAIVELMRILLDAYGYDWDAAWDTVRKTFAYTNHTLMPEALECWSVDLIEKMLPRHMQIIYEINVRFLADVSARFPGDAERLRRMSLIEEGPAKKVRMAHLAIVGSHSVNGVSRLHSDLLKTRVLTDFHELYPEKFNNKTNGITPRRWLLKANPGLSGLISEAIGEGWTRDLRELEKIDALKDQPQFCRQWQNVKHANKVLLAEYIARNAGIRVDPRALFDVQIKRIHEYKRQILFGLYIIAHFLEVKNHSHSGHQPRVFLIGGKAAPGYQFAKLSIKFLTAIADVINRDRTLDDIMKVVFLENYRVSLAERIFPASDLSEQISTAGTEASGTGNMKFMINGALTIGTLDGANIEISERVGEENIFIFGHRAHEIEALRKAGYRPKDFVYRSPVLGEVLDLISTGFFSSGTPGLFTPIIAMLLHEDPFFICADFDMYRAAQRDVSRLFGDEDSWTKKSIINVAKSGYFSSDRTIAEYAREIWKVM